LYEEDRNVSRAIVDEDEEVVEFANGTDFHGIFDVHVNILDEVVGLCPAGTIWLAVKFFKSTASAESLIRRPLLKDCKSNHNLASCHLRHGIGTQMSIALVPHGDWGCWVRKL